MLNTQVIHSRIQNIRLLATKDKIAFKKQSLIRVYQPNPEEWEDGFERRKT